MSKWIRNYNPTEIDTDEWDNILVLQPNRQKAVYNWEDYVDDGMQEQGCAWMPLPDSDIPKSVSVTIEVGDRTYTVENNGFTIEVHDSRDPMGQPTCWQTGDTITGILEAVDAILQEELHGNCDCEDQLDETALTVEDIENILAAEAEVEQLQDAMRAHLNELRGKTAAVPASKKPWNKKK